MHVAYRGDKLVGALASASGRAMGSGITFLGAEQASLADMLLADDAGAKAPHSSPSARPPPITTTPLSSGAARLHPVRLGSGPSRLKLIVRAEAPVLDLDGLDWEAYALKEPGSRRTSVLFAVDALASSPSSEPWRPPSRELAMSRDRPRGGGRAHARRWQGRPRRLRLRNHDRQGVPTGRNGRAGRARHPTDRDAQARRTSDRLRLLLRPRKNDVLPSARLRSGARALVAGCS